MKIENVWNHQLVYIIPQLAVYTLIYHLYIAYWGIIYHRSHLLREPETAIDIYHFLFFSGHWTRSSTLIHLKFTAQESATTWVLLVPCFLEIFGGSRMEKPTNFWGITGIPHKIWGKPVKILFRERILWHLVGNCLVGDFFVCMLLQHMSYTPPLQVEYLSLCINHQHT